MYIRGLGVLALAGALVSVAVAPLGATGGVYTQTKHGNASTGVNRTPDWPVGSCEQCHVQHVGSGLLLFAPNTNALCTTGGCHGSQGPNAIWQGQTAYAASRHAGSSAMVWPGPDGTVDPGGPPARIAGDAGKCVNCHTPHGYADASGLIPSLMFSREEKLCIVCHDGSPATKNIKVDFTKVYRHPAGTIIGKHSVAENGSSVNYGFSPTNNRHSDCEDCHNSHVAKADSGLLVPPAASNRLLGMGRISVTNGPAGTVPSYAYRGPADLNPPREYEICFKCHSSWTTLPPSTPSGGQPKDKALQFNTNNPSFHPIEAAGKNPNINANAFVNNWNATKLMYCTDCHTNDTTSVRGPHGSVYNYILKMDYRAVSGQRTMASAELCFDCHRYDTYANNSASSAVQGYSRFNPPTFAKGHGYHVGDRRYPCFSCHETHGSTTLAALMVVGRSPGLSAYTQTANGGTCTPTCHGQKSYTINYAR